MEEEIYKPRTIPLQNTKYASQIKEIFAAAKQGDPRAQFELAIAYEKGKEIEQNLSRALYWYRQSADGGYGPAALTYGMNLILEDEFRDEKTGVRYIEQAVKDGMPMAMIFLAGLYERGAGVQQNYFEAGNLYKNVTSESEPHVLYCYGMAFLLGSGMHKDEIIALRYLKSAAEAKDMAGMYALGRCYLEGSGVRKNPYTAVKWLRKSAEAGYGRACTLLGDCRRDGNGGKADPEEALILYEKATQGDSPDSEALLRMAQCYEEGIGTKKDSEKAKALREEYQQVRRKWM